MPASMTCKQFDDAEAFLRHAGPLLRDHAIDNNVMLGIAVRLSDEPRDDAVMLTVDEADTPRIAGLMTPPWRLIVSTGSTEAVSVLVEGALESCPRPPGVVGTAAMAGAFAAAWQETTGEKATLAREMNLFIAAQAVVPGGVPGRLRAAVPDDAEWVTEAFVDFAVAIDASIAERNESRKSAAAYMRRGDVHLWDVDGVPVSMACSHRMPLGCARIGPVYTPPAERGRGYASAAAGTLTDHILSSGARWCAIFADVGNATTNAIYRRIGYEEHGSYREYDFAVAGDKNGGAP